MFAFIAPHFAGAHSPHDEILAVQFSPRFAIDLIIFAIVRFNLVRSLDGGLTWTRLVRGLAGVRLLDIAVSPAFDRDRIVFAISDAQGVYRSDDRGLSWTAVAEPPNAKQLSIRLSPDFGADGRVVVVDRSGRLWVSSDRGNSWTAMSPMENSVACASFHGATLYIGTRTGEVLQSFNFGQSWQNLFHEHRIPAAVTGIACTEDAQGRTRSAISTDGSGVAVHSLSNNAPDTLEWSLPGQRMTSITWATQNDGSRALFTTAWNNGVYRSDDFGGTWTSQSKGLTTDPQADYPSFQAPHFRCILASPHFAFDRTLLVAGFDGLFISTDGGQRWLERRGVLPVNLIVGADIVSSRRGQSTLVVSTYGGGPCFSRDSGRSWQTEANGLREARLFGTAFSPGFARDATVFIVSNWALYRSGNGGLDWKSTSLLRNNDSDKMDLAMISLSSLRIIGGTVSRRLGASWFRTLRGLFHRTRGSLGLSLPMPGFGATIVVSPSFARDATLYTHARNALWKSTDGGRSLVRLPEISAEAIRAVAISPDHERDQTLFLSAGPAVYLSKDSGQSWRNSWSPPVNETPGSLVLSPRYGSDQTVLMASGRDLYRSRDEGLSWQKLASIEATTPAIIDSILLPTVSGSESQIFVHVAGEGLFHSTNGGGLFTVLNGADISGTESFSHMEGFPDQAPLIRLSPDYEIDHTLIAASQNRLWISRDRARTWELVRIPARYDAARPEIVFEGTWTTPKSRYATHVRSRCATQKGARALLDFVGTGVRWIGERGPANGMAEVRIDGELAASIDQFAAIQERPTICYESPSLPPGCHRVEINVKGETTGRHGRPVVIGAIEVLGGA